ncbi:MAG: ABC transporter permease [Bacteroidales bacterium]|nr:ABC transporter permease [Bacteroidales bacterium]
MFSNYLTTALRNLLRQKSYTLINLFGLSVGIAAFLLIALYVQHETGFDTHLEHRSNIFRVVEVQNEPGVGEQHVAITMGPLAAAMKEDFPQVTDAVRFMPGFDIPVVNFGDKHFIERNLYYADPSVIKVFGIDLKQGNPSVALSEPMSVVMSEKAAVKYFGSEKHALGKTMLLGKRNFTVTGIMENQPERTHLFFDILVSMSSVENLSDFEWMKGWGSNSLVTYVSLDSPSSQSVIEKAFPEFLKKHVFSTDEGWEFLEMYLQPLPDVYLRSKHIKFQMVSAMGDINLSVAFSVIAVLILLIACVNYINISIARSVKRSREVGVRKVLGADRQSLIYQFISESFILTLLASLFSVGFIELALPEMNQLLSTSFHIDFTGNWLFNIGLLLLIVVISIISGSYPAFYLSRLQPVEVMKGGRGSGSTRGSYLSKGLVMFQFIISVGLMFSVLVINDQVRFLQNKDMGISYRDAVFLSFGNEQGISSYQPLRDELLKNPDIRFVSACSFINGVSGSQGPVFVDDSASTKLTVRFGYVDADFFNSMNVKFTQGRNFSRDIVSDEGRTVIINEAAARKLGWSNAIGKKFKPVMGADTSVSTEVIGVVRDYHYFSLRSLIEPAVYVVSPERFRGLLIGFHSRSDQQKVMKTIEEQWLEFFPESPFKPLLASEFAREAYKNDQNLFSLFIYFTIISGLLSVLGLFGLTSLLIEQKTKTIGIRRVLGGSIRKITAHLIRDYMLLVLSAGIISLPVSYYLLDKQLDQFAYHISISVWHMLLSVLLLAFVAFVTIVVKAYRAARANPVDALKYE